MNIRRCPKSGHEVKAVLERKFETELTIWETYRYRCSCGWTVTYSHQTPKDTSKADRIADTSELVKLIQGD